MAMSQSEFNRRLRDAQRKAQQQINRQGLTGSIARTSAGWTPTNERSMRTRAEVERVNRENKRRVDAYNREVDAHNQKVERHNKAVVADLNKRLQASAPGTVTYRPTEQALAERVHDAINFDDGQAYDVFLSDARIDGEDTATSLPGALERLGVRVWFDAVAIQPGKSQSLEMDAGLRKAGAGVALLMAAYLAGRIGAAICRRTQHRRRRDTGTCTGEHSCV